MDPKNYKSYNELKAKLNRVLGVDAGETMEAPEVHYAAAPSEIVAEPSPIAESNDDDTLSYFAKLAKDN